MISLKRSIICCEKPRGIAAYMATLAHRNLMTL
jgi:hypothetical protein